MATPDPFPVDYATPAPRRRSWAVWLVAALALLAALVVAPALILWFFVASPAPLVTVSPTVNLRSSATSLPQPSRQQEATTPLKVEGEEITLVQRGEQWLPGGLVKLSIDDVTHGQVQIALSEADGTVLLGRTSLRPGNEVSVTPAGTGVPVFVRLVRLDNHLMSDDFAIFRVASASTVPPTTRPADAR